MDSSRPTITSFKAQELEAFAQNLKPVPKNIVVSGHLEALLIGHPLTKLPMDFLRRPSETGSQNRFAVIKQVAALVQRLFTRLIVVYIVLMAPVCFLYRLATDFRSGQLFMFIIDGRQVIINASCSKSFNTIPMQSISSMVLALMCIFFAILTVLSGNWAISFTDYITRRTVALATSHIFNRRHHLYGLFPSLDRRDTRDLIQPMSYLICRLFESGLRSRLSQTVCNSGTVLVFCLCLCVETNSSTLFLRWQIFIGFMLIILFCCLLSSSLRRVQWFKVFHLLSLALTLMLVSKICTVNELLIMAWQLPLNFVHSIRSIEVFNRTSDNFESVLKKHDETPSPSWFFANIQRVAIVFTFSFLLRMINFHRHLNMYQFLFRYSFLLEPVESVALLVAMCHLPPVTIIMLLRSQLKFMTPTEIDTLVLIGAVQSLFTSSRPIDKLHWDFITNSRFLCLLAPLCSVCAIVVATITRPESKKSVLLLRSQRMYNHRRQFARGLRRMVIKQTRMCCRLMLLLVIAHELSDRVRFIVKLAISLTQHHDPDFHSWMHCLVGQFLMLTGSRIMDYQNTIELLCSGRVATDQIIQASVMTQEKFYKMISKPGAYMKGAQSCSMWSAISRQTVKLIEDSAMPAMCSRMQHSAFLLMLRIAQNGMQEIMFFICLLLVNLDNSGKLHLLLSTVRIALGFVLSVALVFATVNFAASISFVS